jgi:3-oxoacyl-[acyl-carrier protein] reductase
MKLLEGKTAIITGASRGIGKAIAESYAQQGANIVITDIGDQENLDKVADALAAQGVKAKGVVSDAASFDDAEKLIETVVEEFETVDVVINNAGITRDNLLLRMGEEDWDLVMKVNLKSVFNLTKHAIRPMMKQRSGSIVNLSSVVGVSGNAGQANYSSSKAGIIGFTKSMAQELGSRNIRVNAIAPGFIATEMTEQLPEDVKDGFISRIPMKRFASPSEVASVALFLGSDLASYVSGQVVNVCGAMNT